MQDRGLDRSFDRFRRQGDVEALGEVFDRTSAELLRVAMFLTRNAAEADDLLQSTFLTVIERADRHDGTRSLVPWMLGILVNHAREQRRRRRDPDPERIEVSSPGDPHEALERQELDEALGRALESLSARDRELLEATLRQGVAPIDFARQHGLAPGTVRMQLHRGLERLRRALPAGFALGGAAILTGGRGHAAVRARVLEAAGRVRPGIAPVATASSPWTLGGMIVSKSLVAAVAAVLVMAAGLWITGRDAQDVRARTDAPETASTRVATPARADVLRPAPVADEPVREDVRARSGPDEVDPDAAYEAALSGVLGRLIEADGTPATGQDVVLLDLDYDDLRRVVTVPARGSSVLQTVVARAVSDADGRFVLRGARASSLHALSGTPRSPRVPLRVVGEALTAGETRDLGDIVLPARGGISGRVLDEQDRPVAGARVRLGPIPAAILDSGAGDLRPESQLFVAQVRAVVPVPSWAIPLQEHLGVAGTTTDAEGRFALDDVAVGPQTIVADHSGRRAAHREVVIHEGGSSEAVLRLESGRAVAGHVTVAGGDPVPGAEVCVGPAPSRFPVTALQPAGRTDAAGRFSIGGLPTGESLIVAARRDSLEPWTVVQVPSTDEPEVELPDLATLRLVVVDDRGRPVPRPDVALLPAPPRPNLAGLVAPVRLDDRQVPSENGTVFPDVAQGTYALVVRAEGFATHSRQVQLEDVECTVLIEMIRAAPLEVHVRDARGGAPVGRASVTWLAQGRGEGVPLDSATTGPEGTCRLHAREMGKGVPAAGILRIQHPAHATTFVEISAGTSPVEVALGTGGVLEVSSATGGEESAGGMLLLTREGATDEVTQLLRLDETGRGSVGMLSIGTWRYELLADWPRDATFLRLVENPALQAGDCRGEFEIREGGVTEVVLSGGRAAAVDLAAGTGVVRGTLRVEGLPLRGVQLSVQGPSITDPVLLELGRDGTFLFESVPEDAHVLVIQFPDREGQEGMGLLGWQSLRELDATARQSLDLDWRREEVLVQVVADGVPVVGAQVRVEGNNALCEETTSSGGRARLSFLGPGPFRIRAQHPEIGATRLELVEAEPELRLTLEPGVPCAGVLRLSKPLDGIADLRVHGGDHSGMGLVRRLRFEGGVASFRLMGLEPGRQVLELWGFDLEFAPVTLDLPRYGDESLDLTFAPARR